MLQRILPDLIVRGATLTNLLNSKVFMFEYDFDEWPSVHTNNKEYIRAYNENIFNIRSHYSLVNPEAELAPLSYE